MDPLFGLAGRWQGLGQSGFLRQCREDTDDRDSRVDEHRLRRLVGWARLLRWVRCVHDADLVYVWPRRSSMSCARGAYR